MQPQPFIGPNDYWSWDFYANIFNSLDWNSLGLYLAFAIAAVLVLWVVFRLLRGIGRAVIGLFRRSPPAATTDSATVSVRDAIPQAKLARMSEPEQLRELVSILLLPKLPAAGTPMSQHIATYRFKDYREAILAVSLAIGDRKNGLEQILTPSPGDRETARLQGAFYDTHFLGVIGQRLVAESFDVARMRNYRNLATDAAESLVRANEWWRKRYEELLALLQESLDKVPDTFAQSLNKQLVALNAKVKTHDVTTSAEIVALKEQLAKKDEIITQKDGLIGKQSDTIATLSTRRPNTDPNKGGKGNDPKKNDDDKDKDKAA